MERSYPKCVVSEKCERFLKGGHVWVYDNEIRECAPCRDGDIVDVYSPKDRYLGSGFYNSHSRIRVRILSKNANDRFEDGRFFARRISYALSYRKTVMPGDDFQCCRLIFGEADGLPGLTVDRYNEYLVSQCLCLGMELRKEEIYGALVSELRAQGEEISALIERNDVKLRELEGMKEFVDFYPDKGLRTDLDGKTEICENGIFYTVDCLDGQKTGFFLDQKYNRRAAARIAEGKTVLDCFTHTGSFALNCAKAGAKSVTGVDISKDAVALCRENARRNELTNVSFEAADVFDLLTELKKAGNSPYDFIILDPPAFTKSGATVKNAYRGYKEINLKAMQLLPRGGYLATCSCSHFMKRELFEEMLREAAHDADVSLRLIESRGQAPDHPVLWNVPETDYLKFYLFQVV